MNANHQARMKAVIRGNHPPRETLKERIWKQAYRRHMIARGCTVADAVRMDPEVDFTYTPEECADAEIDEWAANSDIGHIIPAQAIA